MFLYDKKDIKWLYYSTCFIAAWRYPLFEAHTFEVLDALVVYLPKTPQTETYATVGPFKRTPLLTFQLGIVPLTRKPLITMLHLQHSRDVPICWFYYILW